MHELADAIASRYNLHAMNDTSKDLVIAKMPISSKVAGVDGGPWTPHSTSPHFVSMRPMRCVSRDAETEFNGFVG